jgi:hypothetical protein
LFSALLAASCAAFWLPPMMWLAWSTTLEASVRAWST